MGSFLGHLAATLTLSAVVIFLQLHPASSVHRTDFVEDSLNQLLRPSICLLCTIELVLSSAGSYAADASTFIADSDSISVVADIKSNLH